MTPACVARSENASVADAAEALARHRVHALLVIGATNGTPLGWVTARGLLEWLSRDGSLAGAREAITEQVNAIAPTSERALLSTHFRWPVPPGCSCEASPT